MRKLILLILILMFSCSNDDLTEIRNDGTGGISCLIDGKLFKQKTLSLHGPTRENFYVSKDQGIWHIAMVLSIENSNHIRETIYFSISDVEYKNPSNTQINSLETTYLLTKNIGFGNSSFGTYEKRQDVFNSENYTTTENYLGELNINFHNIEDQVVSGTFWFDAVDKNGEIVEIREGRFDKKITHL